MDNRIIFDGININLQEILNDIMQNSESLDNIKITLEKDTRNVTIVFEDLDDEWFKELINESDK